MTLSRKTQESLLERGYSRRQIGRILWGPLRPFLSSMNLPWRSRPSSREPAAAAAEAAEAVQRAPLRSGCGPHHLQREPDGPLQRRHRGHGEGRPAGLALRPAGRKPRFNGPARSSTENVKPGYVDAYPGSSIPLANCAAAFTSPTRSWVMGSPGYGSGARQVCRQQSGPGAAAEGLFARCGSHDQGRPECGRVLHLQSQQSHRHAHAAEGLRVHSGQQAEGRRPGHRRGVRPFFRPRQHVHRPGDSTTRMSWCSGPSRRSTAWRASAPACALWTPGPAGESRRVRQDAATCRSPRRRARRRA